MKLKGTVSCDKTPNDLRQRFFDAEHFQNSLPFCKSLEELERGYYLAQMHRARDKEQEICHYYRVRECEDDHALHLSVKSADPRSPLVTSQCEIQLVATDKGADLEYNAMVKISADSADFQADEAIIRQSIQYFFNAIADEANREGPVMTDKEKASETELEKAIHKAEDAVIELEHEAEEAAARGFLGGAQMWGLIALAVLIGILLLFF